MKVTGMFLLSIWLIATGVLGVVSGLILNVGFVLNILAIAAGVMLLMKK